MDSPSLTERWCPRCDETTFWDRIGHAVLLECEACGFTVDTDLSDDEHARVEDRLRREAPVRVPYLLL